MIVVSEQWEQNQYNVTMALLLLSYGETENYFCIVVAASARFHLQVAALVGYE